MSTAIAERPATLPADELDLIRRTVANGASDAELKLFLFDCQRRGIHPLDKLLHFTKRGGKYTPVTSIDFMRAQAAMSGEMAGSDDAVFLNDENDRLESARVTVYRLTQGQRFGYSATARWAEYCPDNAPMWKRMPHTMLGKCAEALALRKAFPQQLAGLYSREEMDQADNPRGYVVEAPAPSEKREKPSAPNGGASGETTTARGDVIPAHMEDDGPDLAVDLPPGARLITKVEAGAAGAKARIYFNAPFAYAEDKGDFLCFKQQLADLASELCQLGEACLPELKKSATGNWRVENIARVPNDYNPPAGKAPVGEPIDASQIPF